MRRTFFVAFALLATVTNSSAGAASQAGSANAEKPPQECRVEPRFLESLPGQASSRAQGKLTPTSATSTPGRVGGPADSDTVEAIEATLQEAAACANAGDLLRGLALVTEAEFRRRVGNNGVMSPAQLAAMKRPPVPMPEDERVAVREIVSTVVLPDGRVQVVVEAGYPEDPNVLIMAKVGGRWLIDEVLEERSA